MKQAEPYQYVTPTVQSNDPRMLRAIDGWLGLYEACYVIGKAMREGLVVAEDRSKYGNEPSSQPDPSHVFEALIKAAQALNEWNGLWVLGGGLALNFHGHRRATDDVDFFVLEDKDKLAPVVSALTKREVRPHSLERASFMPPEAHWWWVPFEYGSPNAAPVNVDLLVASHEFMAFIHATGIESDINGTRIRVIGPEAFLVLKLQAYRDQDKADLQTLLRGKIKFNPELLSAWVKKFSLESRLAEMEQIVKANPKRLG
jgi:predicted nucleotidyltransferase